MWNTLFAERRRRKAVQRLSMLSAADDPTLNRFTDQAASAFDAPISLLSFIYDDMQWFKACTGLTIECIDRSEGFCSYALDKNSVFEVCDPLSDARFAKLPVVTGEPHIRYYIGAPLRLESGVDVGALCVLDGRSRRPASDDQKAYLAALARQATQALEARVGAAYGGIAG